MYTGYTKIGKVIIGNNVFIGAGSIVLPNVTIGDDVIIGAGSIVSKDIPNNSVAVGNPIRIIGKTTDYIEKNKLLMEKTTLYDESYTIKGNITYNKKQEMKESLKNNIAYVR